MNSPAPTAKPSVELDRLLTPDQRRVSVSDHLAFRNAISTPADYDEIDEMLDEEIEIDPYQSGTNSRRSDKELARMLDLIDNLPISDQGKEGTI